MSQKDQEPSDNEEYLPNKCPVCDEVVEKLVLHISRNKSCHSNIDPELFQKWKLISRRRARRNYQAKYVKSGWHNEAQSRYVNAGGHKKSSKGSLNCEKSLKRPLGLVKGNQKANED